MDGQNLGNDPTEVRALVVSAEGDQAISFEISNVNDSSLTGNLGPVNPDWVGVKPGPIGKPVPNFNDSPIRVFRGEGLQGGIGQNSHLDDGTVNGRDYLFWQRNAGATSSSRQAFATIGASKPIGFKPVDKPVKPVRKGIADDAIGYLFGDVQAGALGITIPSGFPAGTRVNIVFSAHNDSLGLGTEILTPPVIPQGNNALQIARNILDGLQLTQDVLSQALTDSSPMDWSLDTIEGEGHRISATFEGGAPVEFGAFTIGVITIPSGGSILPGDCNSDGTLDITDVICTLGFLFLGEPSELPCAPAGEPEPDDGDRLLIDWNGDGGNPDLTDAIAMLAYLFLGSDAHVLGTSCTTLPGCPDACNR